MFSTKNKPPAQNKLLPWLCTSAIAVITLIVFSPSLQDGFTNWDDPAYVQDNPLVVNNSIPIVKIFKTPVASNYHPLTILSLALNYQFGKLDPASYHAVNLIIHILNTMLVFIFIFLLMQGNVFMASIVSLFFGIHPMHVESVAWISERKDVLYVFFFLLGLITYLRYSETKKIIWYILTFLLFILSCLSKGMAVVFPVILLLIDYLRRIKWERRVIIEKIPFFILALAFGIVAVKGQDYATVGLKSYTFLLQLMFASYGAIIYIVKFFVPHKLSAFYPRPLINDNNGIPIIFYLSPFILLAILILIIYFFRRDKREIVFGLLLYFVTIVLVLQFISVGAALIADRYTYLPYVGISFVVAYFTNSSCKIKSGLLAAIKYLLIVILIVAAFLFCCKAYSLTQIWKDSDLLWTNVIANYPNTSIAYVSRAEYYSNNNENEKALADYNTALQLPPTDPTSYRNAYYNRGILYLDFYKKADMALADFNSVITLDSNFASVYNYRGLLYVRTGKMDLAMSDFNKSISLDSNNATAYSNRAFLYFNRGDYNSALIDCNKAITYAPASAIYYNNRSMVEDKIGKKEAAQADALKAVQLQGK